MPRTFGSLASIERGSTMRAFWIGSCLWGLLALNLAVPALAQMETPLDLPTSPTDMFRSSTGTTPDLGSSSLDELNDFEQSLFSNGGAPQKTVPKPSVQAPAALPTGQGAAPKKTLQDWLKERPASRPTVAPRQSPPPSAAAAIARPRPGTRPVPPVAKAAPVTKAAPRKKTENRRKARAKDPKERKKPAALRLFAELRHLVELEYERRQVLTSRSSKHELLALDNELTLIRQRILDLKTEKKQEDEAATRALLAPSEIPKDEGRARRKPDRRPMESSPLSSPMRRGFP